MRGLFNQCHLSGDAATRCFQAVVVVAAAHRRSVERDTMRACLQ